MIFVIVAIEKYYSCQIAVEWAKLLIYIYIFFLYNNFIYILLLFVLLRVLLLLYFFKIDYLNCHENNNAKIISDIVEIM